jgi:nicotinic acetylcholine receptor
MKQIFCCFDSVDMPNDLSYHPTENHFRLSITNNGVITWYPSISFQTTCLIDLTYFPFDEQNCCITITNWAYRMHQQNFILTFNYVYMGNYENNSEWEFIDSKVTKRIQNPEDGIYPVELVDVCMRIRRKAGYYIWNIMLPCTVLLLLSSFTYLLPPESGEKISLGISITLALSVFLLLVSDIVPRASHVTPLFGMLYGYFYKFVY